MTNGRHGTAEKPWKTLAYAQKNADSDVTGVVVRGAFDVAKGFVFAPGWSYTGFGTATVFDNKGGELAVKMNSFYRPVTTPTTSPTQPLRQLESSTDGCRGFRNGCPRYHHQW